MKIKPSILLFAWILCVSPTPASAQSFDSLKKNKSQDIDAALSGYLDKNDTRGLTSYLRSHPKAVNQASTTELKKKSNTVTSPVLKPLLHDAVGRALEGKVSPEMCTAILDADADINILFDSKAPVYYIMDYIATHPKQDCSVAEQLLAIFYARQEFDINRSCGSFPPPFAYLIRENYSYLGGKYSPEYISDKVVEMSLAEGAPVNTYNSDGSSLMLLANASGSEYLQNLFLDSGINIDRKASESGDDAVVAAIKRNNIATLEKLLQNYSVPLTTEYVMGAVPEMNSEMYDFVAKKCADSSDSYEELVLFRNTFGKRKSLVDRKYTDMARAEVNAANNYDAIARCRTRFPDLYESIVLPKRKQIAAQEIAAAHSIQDVKLYEEHYADLPANPLVQTKKEAFYQQDVQRLEASYQRTTDDIKAGRNALYFRDEDRKTVNDFETYYDYYDPQQKKDLAMALKSYYDNVAFCRNFKPASYKRFGLLLPKIDGDDYRRDLSAIESRREKIRSLRFGLNSEMLDQELLAVRGKMEAQWKKDYAAYESELHGGGSSSSSSQTVASSSQSEASSKEEEDNMSCRVHLHYSNGDDLYEGTITVYFKGFLNLSSKTFTTDKHGRATLTWSDEYGETIDAIYVHPTFLIVGSHTIENLDINDGGNYEICIDCNP
jgi:hypothetical protein